MNLKKVGLKFFKFTRMQSVIMFSNFAHRLCVPFEFFYRIKPGLAIKYYNFQIIVALLRYETLTFLCKREIGTSVVHGKVSL